MRFISTDFGNSKRFNIDEYLLYLKLLCGEDKQVGNFQNSQAIDN